MLLFSVLLVLVVTSLAEGSLQEFKDYVGLCLNYGCGTADASSLVHSSNELILRCKNCSPVKNDLPRAIDGFCNPISHGGTVRIPIGKVTLASAAVLVPHATVLGFNETYRLEPTDRGGWTLHEESPRVTHNALSLASCVARKSPKLGVEELVEVQYITFIGCPKNGKTVTLSIESVMNLAEYSGVTHTLKKKRLFGRFGTKRVGIKAGEALIFVKSSTLKISESHRVVPSEAFETRVTCGQRKCAFGDWHGCFHLTCSAVTGPELAIEAATHQASELLRQRVIAAREKILQEREEERLRQEERLREQLKPHPDAPIYVPVPVQQGEATYDAFFEWQRLQQQVQQQIQQQLEQQLRQQSRAQQHLVSRRRQAAAA